MDRYFDISIASSVSSFDAIPFFHIATVVILASSACLGAVESLFSAATSETTTACGTVTVDHFQ